MACEHLRITWNVNFYHWDDSSDKDSSVEFRSPSSPLVMSTKWYLSCTSVYRGQSCIPGIGRRQNVQFAVQLRRKHCSKNLQLNGFLYHGPGTWMFSFDGIMDSDTKYITILESHPNNIFECHPNSLPKERVTLTCDAWITELTETEQKSVQTPSTFCKLLLDMHAMYVKQEYCNLIIVCKDVRFPVHKCVLSARSPVFAKILTDEGSRKRLVVRNIDPDVLEELLQFLYCGKINPSIYRKAHDLYYAAEKYSVSDLKDICRDIISSLSVTTALKTFILADRHKDEEMKQEAVTFIASTFQTAPSTTLLRKPPLANRCVSSVTEYSDSENSDNV